MSDLFVDLKYWWFNLISSVVMTTLTRDMELVLFSESTGGIKILRLIHLELYKIQLLTLGEWASLIRVHQSSLIVVIKL